MADDDALLQLLGAAESGPAQKRAGDHRAGAKAGSQGTCGSLGMCRLH